MERKALAGPKPVAYYKTPMHRLVWERATPPTGYKCEDYRVVYYRGVHVGEFFKGRSGRWFGCVFGRPFVFGYIWRDVALHMTGMIVGWQA